MKKRIIFGICSVICSILLITPSFIKVNAYPFGVDAQLMVPFDAVVYSSNSHDELFSIPYFYESGSSRNVYDNLDTQFGIYNVVSYDATNIDGVFEDFPFFYGRVSYSAFFYPNSTFNKITFFASNFFVDYDINYFNQNFVFYGGLVDVVAVINLGAYSYSYEWNDIDEENINLKDLFALVPISFEPVYYVDTLLLEVTYQVEQQQSCYFDYDLLTFDADAYNTFVHDYLASLPEVVEHTYTINIFDSLLMSIDAFFTTELIPGISIIVILGICLAVPLVIMILKMWLGG